MKFVRKPEMVEAFHYDLKHEGEVEQKLDFNLEPVEKGTLDFETAVETEMMIYVDYVILLEEIVISGRVTQLVGIEDRAVESPEEFSKADLDELIAPLLAMIQRLTYEVTEITLDRPGITLNFAAGE